MSANQKVLGELVKREVIVNVSELVSHFMINPEFLNGSGYSYDDLMELSETYDYEEAGRSYVDGWEADNCRAYFQEKEIDIDDFDLPEDRESGTYLDALIQAVMNDIEDWREFCWAHNIELENYRFEALEFWAVSRWFAEKLAEKGEAVGELFGLNIWGRATSGQAILLDSVIEEIGRDMEILEGQANHKYWI